MLRRGTGDVGVAGVVAVSSSEEEEEEVMAAGKMEGFDGRMPSWFYSTVDRLVVLWWKE